ncbi:hypothetical protein [Erwinia sp. PsM31]|uniref:hypothetical protein n=1 Tax=Erwinia sp. PsM31 TaxID=3030535 RepID=UPI00263A493E|nr:hypothetical protein [Erwinia sp. PsM31]MDN4625624.1 hypothetical protein [Erwinia sp. PsM31]
MEIQNGLEDYWRMENKTAIREKILSNNFTRKDYFVFKNNVQLIKQIYHPDLTTGIDLPEAITQMAEDSTKLRNIAVIYVVLFLILLFRDDKVPVLINITVVTIVLLIVLWTNACQRHLPVSTELRLMKLAIRMRKILKARAREEKARIKAEKKRQRAG